MRWWEIVLVSLVAAALGMILGPGWPWWSFFAFGAIVSIVVGVVRGRLH